MFVFYAVKDKKKFWLYPLAVLAHTTFDFSAGLVYLGIWNPPAWLLEGIVAIIGSAVFFGAYFLLYKKDEDTVVQ